MHISRTTTLTHVFHILVSVFVFTDVAFYAMDNEQATPVAASSSTEPQCKTRKQVIQDYFFAPDKAMRWFTEKQPNVIKLTHLQEDTITFTCCKNKAAKHKQELSKYGVCTYAMKKGDTLLAGFSNSSVLVKRIINSQVNIDKLITLPPEFSTFGHIVTAAIFADADSHGSYPDEPALLVGFGDRSLFSIDCKTEKAHFLCKVPMPITTIMRGHLPNMWIVSGGDHVAMVEDFAGKGDSYYCSIGVGAQITALGLFECGFAVRTTNAVDAHLPYSLVDYRSIRVSANYLSKEQENCVVRLIAAQKLGMKRKVKKTEKECFAALPAIMQKMLLE